MKVSATRTPPRPARHEPQHHEPPTGAQPLCPVRLLGHRPTEPGGDGRAPHVTVDDLGVDEGDDPREVHHGLRESPVCRVGAEAAIEEAARRPAKRTPGSPARLSAKANPAAPTPMSRTVIRVQTQDRPCRSKRSSASARPPDEGEDGEGDEHCVGRAASVGVEALRSPLPPRLDISPTALDWCGDVDEFGDDEGTRGCCRPP